MKINIAEADAWITKYFIAASVIEVLLLLTISGTKEIKLISNPNHAENQFMEEIDKIDPNIVIIRKIIFKLFIINK